MLVLSDSSKFLPILNDEVTKVPESIEWSGGLIEDICVVRKDLDKQLNSIR